MDWSCSYSVAVLVLVLLVLLVVIDERLSTDERLVASKRAAKPIMMSID